MGLVSVGNVTFAALSFNAMPPLSLVLMAFCLTVSSYAIDRVADCDGADRITNGERVQRLQRSRWFRGGAAALFAFAVVIGLSSPAPIAGLYIFLFPLSVALYGLPWLGFVPWLARRGIRRIKDIPYAKNFYTSACLAAMVPFSALLIPAPGAGRIAAAYAYVFVMMIINTVACDIKDVEADRLTGVRTIAGALGLDRTVALLHLINNGSAVLLVVLIGAGALPRTCVWVSLNAMGHAICLERMRSRGADMRPISEVGPDVAAASIGFFSALGIFGIGG
jgi:4-hydroxybenzoate polyprenyltransferase